MGNNKLGWIGTAAFQALPPKGDELVFDLAENVSMPSEWQQGDEIEIENRPPPPAMIAIDMNTGYYEVTHLKSGKKFKVLHKNSEWRFK